MSGSAREPTSIHFAQPQQQPSGAGNVIISFYKSGNTGLKVKELAKILLLVSAGDAKPNANNTCKGVTGLLLLFEPPPQAQEKDSQQTRV